MEDGHGQVHINYTKEQDMGNSNKLANAHTITNQETRPIRNQETKTTSISQTRKQRTNTKPGKDQQRRGQTKPTKKDEIRKDR